jgi:excisionase family DNA binding protein
MTTQHTTVEAAAGELMVSLEHVRRLVRLGRLKAYRPSPRKTLIITSSLKDYIDANNCIEQHPASHTD